MALSKLLTIPSASQRIGQGTLRFNSATDRQMKFVAAAGSGHGPFNVVAANDFLIFGRIGHLSGVQAVPFWWIQDANNQGGIFLNTTQTTLGAWWRFNNGGAQNRDISFTIPASSPNVPHCGSCIQWCWQRVADQHRIGVINGHTLAMSWSSWVTDIAATLGNGANWNNYAAASAFQINSSSASNYFAGMYSALTFVAVTSGQMDNAGLLDDADVVNVMLDPQRIFDAGRTGIVGRVSYGDVVRSSTKVSVHFPSELVTGDTLVCPITGKALSLTIGTNSSATNKINQVMPPHTLPAPNTATIFFDKDAQPASQHYLPAAATGGGSLADVSVVVVPGTNNNKRHFYLAVTDPATGLRVRPLIQIPVRMNYSDESGGNYTKAGSFWMQITASADYHWQASVVNLGGSLVIVPSFHSEGFATGSGVTNIPASGDCAWMMTQVLHYADGATPDDDGFTLYEPQDSLVTWTQAPGSSSTHTHAIMSYSSCAQISAPEGSESLDGAVVTAIRNRDTAAGDNSMVWFKEGSGSQVKQLTQSGGSSGIVGAIPIGSFDLGDGYFVVVMTPRYSDKGFYGLIGFVGRNDAGLLDNDQWWGAGNGEVLDGSGPGTLTLPVTRGVDQIQFGFRDQVGASPETSKSAAECFEINQVGDHLVALLCVGPAGSIDNTFGAEFGYSELLLRSWRFNPESKALEQVDSIDLFDELDAVLGTDPNFSDEPEAKYFQSSVVVQPVPGRGFVLWMRSREQTTLTNGTHYSDFPTRYGVRIIGMYFPDPANLSRHAWLTEEDGTTLFEAWNVADDGGLACGPRVYGATGHRSSMVSVLVFAGVGSSSSASVAYPLVDASQPITRAIAQFTTTGRSRVSVGIGVGLGM